MLRLKKKNLIHVLRVLHVSTLFTVYTLLLNLLQTPEFTKTTVSVQVYFIQEIYIYYRICWFSVTFSKFLSQVRIRKISHLLNPILAGGLLQIFLHIWICFSKMYNLSYLAHCFAHFLVNNLILQIFEIF